MLREIAARVAVARRDGREPSLSPELRRRAAKLRSKLAAFPAVEAARRAVELLAAVRAMSADGGDALPLEARRRSVSASDGPHPGASRPSSAN